MLDLSPDKLAMLALVALVVLGPNRLPQAARSLGRFVAAMRSMTSTFREEVSGALDSSGVNLSDLADLHPANIRRNVVGTVTGMLDPAAPQASQVMPPAASSPGTQPEPWGATPDDPSLN
ncbi:MAG: twin-arginine translocase TatA/TatE family subunit [Acidimicrobiales bacterium]